MRDIISEAIHEILTEIGNTPQGLGLVAKNVDRRTSQLSNTENNNSATPAQKVKTMGKAFTAQSYLGQAIRNALNSGMSEQDIEQVLKQNMAQNYNPTFNNNTLTWNRR